MGGALKHLVYDLRYGVVALVTRCEGYKSSSN